MSGTPDGPDVQDVADPDDPRLDDFRDVVLVGAEGPGLTAATLRFCDVRVRIPMLRGTDSLNVATAAALTFYERARFDSRLRLA